MASFSAQQKLKQATYTFIVSQLLTKDEKEKIDAIFRAMDVDCDGKLSREEIKHSWNEYFGQDLSKAELETIFEQVDSDESGEIDYSEFVMGTMNAKSLVSEKRLEAAFRAFDRDGNGQISPEEVRLILGGSIVDDKAVAKIIAQVDADSGLLYIRGAVPGSRNGIIEIRAEGEMSPVEAFEAKKEKTTDNQPDTNDEKGIK